MAGFLFILSSVYFPFSAPDDSRSMIWIVAVILIVLVLAAIAVLVVGVR